MKRAAPVLRRHPTDRRSPGWRCAWYGMQGAYKCNFCLKGGEKMTDEGFDLVEKRFMDHLIAIDEVETSVLKCHLLIEEQFDSITANSVANPSRLSDMRLSFSEKLKIARSMAILADRSRFWEIAEKFNRLRNAVAHRLDPAIRQTAMKAVLEVARAEALENERDELDEEKGEGHQLVIVGAMCFSFFRSVADDSKKWRDFMNSTVIEFYRSGSSEQQ